MALNRSGTPIADLELSVRATNCLQNWRPGITIEELDKMSDLDLLRIPHMGRRTVKEIREVIRSVRQSQLSISQEVMLWADAHQTLVLALIRGEAVIVPTPKGIGGRQ